MMLTTTRTITTDECPWLAKDIPSGTQVLRVSDPYGCCGPAGLPVQLDDVDGYVEVPRDAVTKTQ